MVTKIGNNLTSITLKLNLFSVDYFLLEIDFMPLYFQIYS